MRKHKEIILVWLTGTLICSVLTFVLVHIAFWKRGYWAIGGEYSLIPLTNVICTFQTEHIKKKNRRQNEIALLTEREP